MKVAIYCRTSTKQQDIKSQLEAVREFCERRRYEIAREYFDHGISGDTPDLERTSQRSRRIGFETMMLEVVLYPCPFDAIIVWDMSRFTRQRALVAEKWENLLRREGIGLLAMYDDFDIQRSIYGTPDTAAAHPYDAACKTGWLIAPMCGLVPSEEMATDE